MIKKELVNKIFEVAMSKGAEFAEVFAEDKFNTNISVSNENIDTGIVATDIGIGIRIFGKNNYAYTYTNDCSEKSLLKATEEACKALCFNKNITINNMIFKQENYSDRAEKYFSQVLYKDKIELIKYAINSCKSYDRCIERAAVKYLDQEQKVIIANTDGLWRADNRIKTRLMITAYAHKNGVTESAYIGPGAAMGFEFYDKIDIDYYAKEAARSAVTMVNAEYCPSGQMSVVIDNGFGGLMFHEACGHSLEASVVSKGSSEFAGKIGQQVASEEITLIDDGNIKNAWGSLNIDDEGTKTQKNVLIENGILKMYLVDKFNGKKMNMESTGSGRRESYKYAPTARMSNTYIESGKYTKNQIIENTNKGLFVKSINAGSVNPLTGEFNFSVGESYLIEKGKLTKAVKGATLIGTGTDVLRLVDMTGDNLDIGQGYCYAASGALFIGAGQPTVRVSNMTVGGMRR